jgi:hypothetical protein
MVASHEGRCSKETVNSKRILLGLVTITHNYYYYYYY